MNSCVSKKLKSLNVEQSEQIVNAANLIADASKRIDNAKVEEETSTLFGSYHADQDVLNKIRSGEYREVADKSAILRLVDDTFGDQMINEMLLAYKSGIPLKDDYLQYAINFVATVKSALANSTAEDVVHRFSVYETDNEFTTAFWKDGTGLDDNGSVNSGHIVILNGKSGSVISNNGELLLHEFAHSATELAMQQDGKLSRSVAQIQKEVMKQLTWSNLVAHIPQPTESEIQRAKSLIRYMNGDPSEFLAYAISNPFVFETMKNMRIKIDTFQVSAQKNAFTAVLDKMKEFLNQIISVITNGPTAAHALSNQLGNIIAKNMNIKAKMYTGETFDDYDAKVTGGKFAKVDAFMKEGSSKIEQRLSTMSEMHPRTKQRLSEFMGALGEVKYLRDVRDSGVMQSIAHTMFRQTTNKEFAASFQLIRKIKTDNDKEQNSLKEINANLVNSWFKDIPLNQRMAITDLLAVDPAALNMGKEEIADLLSDPSKIESMIASLSNDIGENEYLNQARDLGWYMIHGTSKNPFLQTNAYRIYFRMYNGVKQAPLKPDNHSVNVSNINQLATLFAMKYIDDRNKELIVRLITNKNATAKSSETTNEEEYHVVDLALDMYKTSRDNEIAQFQDYARLLDKGYLRKASKREMKARIVPEFMIEDMKKRGFDRYEFSQPATDMRNDGIRYYMMYAPDYSVSRTQGAIHDVGYFDQVQQMKDIYDGDEERFEKNTKLVEERKRFLVDNNSLSRRFVNMDASEMRERDDNLMPVMKLDGTIVDYSVPISRYSLENNMAADRDIASVLAATVTHRSAKVKSIRNNAAVVDHLIVNELTNSDNTDYVVLSKEGKYADKWAMIPEYTRDYIYNQKKRYGFDGDPASILIHKDMIDDFIGYKDVSFANLKLGTGGKYFNMQNHPAMALKAEQFQYYLKKLIARYKTVLVILNPDVVIGNAISNFNMAMVHGIDPISYMKLFAKHWRSLDDYNEVHIELLKAQSERDAGVKGLDNRIIGLEKRLAANDMHELMKDGQFNMILEDLDTHNNKEDHVEFHKRRLLEKVIGVKGGETAKGVIENVALTKDSSSFKTIEKLTAYNDIINRAIVREKMLFELDQDIRSGKISPDEKMNKEREILDYIDQLFINYSYLDNKYIKYANDVGLLLFTKYLFRAMKTMKQIYDKKPLALTAFIGLEATEAMPSMLDENPYSNYADPMKALKYRVGPVAGLDFMELAKKILMPGSFNII